MFKLFAFVFCVLVTSYYANAALSIQKDEKPDDLKDQAGCYVSNLRRVLPFGERASDECGACQEYICPTDTTEEYYQTATCPNYSEGCITVPGNPEALYPGCCESINAENTSAEGGQCSAVG